MSVEKLSYPSPKITFFDNDELPIEEGSILTEVQKGISTVLTSWTSRWEVRKTCDKLRVFRTTNGILILSLDLLPIIGNIKENDYISFVFQQLFRTEARMIREKVLPDSWGIISGNRDKVMPGMEKHEFSGNEVKLLGENYQKLAECKMLPY
jgi:hypothetical protein